MMQYGLAVRLRQPERLPARKGRGVVESRPSPAAARRLVRIGVLPTAAVLARSELGAELAAGPGPEQLARVEPVLGDRPREDRRRLSGEVGDVGEQGAEVEGAREAGDGGGAVHA